MLTIQHICIFFYCDFFSMMLEYIDLSIYCTKEGKMTCANCGSQNKPDASFCPHCGIQLAGVGIPFSAGNHPVQHAIGGGIGWRRQVIYRFIDSIRLWMRKSSF
jgi:hypothetical protein